MWGPHVILSLSVPSSSSPPLSPSLISLFYFPFGRGGGGRDDGCGCMRRGLRGGWPGTARLRYTTAGPHRRSPPSPHPRWCSPQLNRRSTRRLPRRGELERRQQWARTRAVAVRPVACGGGCDRERWRRTGEGRSQRRRARVRPPRRPTTPLPPSPPAKAPPPFEAIAGGGEGKGERRHRRDLARPLSPSSDASSTPSSYSSISATACRSVAAVREGRGERQRSERWGRRRGRRRRHRDGEAKLEGMVDAPALTYPPPPPQPPTPTPALTRTLLSPLRRRPPPPPMRFSLPACVRRGREKEERKEREGREKGRRKNDM